MKITYTPADGEPQVFTYDSDDLLMAEVKLIEKAAGVPLDIVEFQLQAGGYTERLIVLWALMRREEPHLRLEKLETTARKREITVEYDRAERAAMREKILKAPNLTDDDRQAVISLLDAEDAADPEPADGPKELRAVGGA